MIIKERLDEYFRLMEERPQLFLSSDVIEIVKDRGILEEYTKNFGKELGVIYKSDYNLLVVDLVRSCGNLFPYERIIPTADGRGVVCIPVYNRKLVLLRQYRHATRSEQICFPRGFGEKGLPSYENAKKELYEEIGAGCKEVVKIGELTPDSGLISSVCDVYLCSVSNVEMTADEGITDMLFLSVDELKGLVSNEEIADGFTLAAIAILDAVGIDIEAFSGNIF